MTPGVPTITAPAVSGPPNSAASARRSGRTLPRPLFPGSASTVPADWRRRSGERCTLGPGGGERRRAGGGRAAHRRRPRTGGARRQRVPFSATPGAAERDLLSSTPQPLGEAGGGAGSGREVTAVSARAGGSPGSPLAMLAPATVAPTLEPAAPGRGPGTGRGGRSETKSEAGRGRGGAKVARLASDCGPGDPWSPARRGRPKTTAGGDGTSPWPTRRRTEDPAGLSRPGACRRRRSRPEPRREGNRHPAPTCPAAAPRGPRATPGRPCARSCRACSVHPGAGPAPPNPSAVPNEHPPRRDCGPSAAPERRWAGSRIA